MTDLVPVLLTGRLAIERYGPSGFRIGGTIHRGPVLVLPDRVVPWRATKPSELTREDLGPVIAHGEVEILVLGCGRRMTAVGGALRAELRQAGIAVEAMTTDAACRTYNLLLSEDRRVAAALFPPL